MERERRNLKSYFLLYIRGLAMGAADVIPGVSGGTIAFITGIYEELLDSLRSFNPRNFRLIFIKGFGAFWKAVNGNFLAAVLFGIATSIFSLAKLMEYLLHHHPIFVWSFFFGLIIVSAIGVLETLKKTTMPVFIAFASGTMVAYLITVISPAETPDTLWFICLCGAVAICAMILPGISGSFILLLMGKYQYILNALTELKISILATFLCGAVIGLLAFSHVLNWLLNRIHDIVIALLAGFMFGSLNKVWPWKVIASSDPVMEKNVLPGTYAAQAGSDSHLFWAIIMAASAVALYYSIMALSKRKSG